jgi:two-component system phosphate regulon sensor histidine kinase PhoR
VAALLATGDRPAIAAYCAELGARSATRVTVIAPDGTVLGDSKENPARMDNHLDRPEVRAALGQPQPGSARRWSHTLREDYLYFAQTVPPAASVPAGILRVAVPVRDFDQNLWAVRRQTWITTALLMVAAAGLSLLLTRHITRPLRAMREGARRFARGDFRTHLSLRHSAEMDSLAEDLNEMATQLDDRFRTITLQRAEMEAILGGMTEGVVAVDAELRILKLNQAAAAMLGVSADNVRGRTLLEAVRNTALQEIIGRALAAPEPVEGEALLRQGPADLTVQVRAAALHEGACRTGVVAVLHDVTRLRRLENLRREFVANVSHELRTPVTAIQGFVETLQDGALQEPGKALRFLDIIARQSSRLNRIIEDLLQLSRLETEAEQGGITAAPCALHDLLQTVVQGAMPAAAEKGIPLSLHCEPADLALVANPNLVQQAVANLVDNALKYSEAGRPVVIRAERGPAGGVRIEVRDQGCGIPAEHQQRVFERFHRVDKGRSRDLGGTGLGLAIVKHIMQAHGGRVELESAPGRGSTFTLVFP